MWSADELKKEHRTVVRTPQCHLTCNPSDSGLHLWLMLVFAWCLWWVVITNTAKDGQWKPTLQIPLTKDTSWAALMSSTTGQQWVVKEIFPKRGGQNMHLSLKPVQMIFHWQTQEFNTFCPDLWQMLQLNISQAEFDTVTLAKDA